MLDLWIWIWLFHFERAKTANVLFVYVYGVYGQRQRGRGLVSAVSGGVGGEGGAAPDSRRVVDGRRRCVRRFCVDVGGVRCPIDV
uniref:Putative secreted protein n=1 Tax=Ixodes ricinus TaxID=34613 RepID=A0A6B0U8Z7_IXORI